jgi:7-keto-8-aminopelargonate synthetase-like enzyme
LEEAKEMEENNQQQNNNHTNNNHLNNNHLNLISNYQQQRKMINLTSDNWTGAHPAITEALLHHSAGGAKAYGESDLDKKIEEKFVQIFERKKVAVYFVGTGEYIL